MRQQNSDVIEQIYRYILGRGLLFTRCTTKMCQVGPQAGNASSRLDIISLKKFKEIEALVWCQFETSILDLENNGKIRTNAKITSDMTLHAGTEAEECAVRALSRRLIDCCIPVQLFNMRASVCSAGFVGGTQMEDLEPTHELILPTLVAAAATLTTGFHEQVQSLMCAFESEHDQNFVYDSLDATVKRFSAYVAQAQRDLLKQKYGLS